MDSKSGLVRSIFLSGALAAAVMGAACAHHPYRVYDAYYSDYHVWNGTEEGYYHSWATENHRDPNRDFRHIPAEEQKEYWNWRHSHGEDHDHH